MTQVGLGGGRSGRRIAFSGRFIFTTAHQTIFSIAGVDPAPSVNLHGQLAVAQHHHAAVELADPPASALDRFPELQVNT